MRIHEPLAAGGATTLAPGGAADATDESDTTHAPLNANGRRLSLAVNALGCQDPNLTRRYASVV
jgi:hypothetical protein